MRYLTTLFLATGALFAADRPNILFIAVDDLVPTLGAYGDPYAQTPAIDTLAAQGTTFLNHHVQWSVCGPSRASLTTSLMPEETGVTGFKAIRHPDYLPDVTFLPEHFRNQGYETGCSGKFHDNRTVGTPGTTLTNDQYEDGNSVDDPASWSIPWTGGGSGYNPSGKPAYDYANDTDADFIDYDILSNGLALIDTMAAGTKPFFLAVGFKKPHLGFIAPTKYWDLYDTDGDGNYDDDFPLPAYTGHPTGASTYVEAVISDNDELLGYAPFNTAGLPTEAEIRELRTGYYACVSFIDHLVGQLMDKLAVTDDPLQAGKKLSETTIIVLWGDHGFYLGEQGRWAKHSNLERGTSSPLIIYDPRNPAGGVQTHTPVNTVDIYPTLCELAGLPIPEQPLSNTVLSGRPLRGRSLVPVLEDPHSDVNGGAINQFNQGGAFGYSYRTERYRLIEWVNGSNNVLARDLYDYTNEPLEKVNVAADPAYESILYQLSESMRAEPTTQGMTRLQSSSVYPVPTSPALVPDLAVADAPTGYVGVEWPFTHAVTYRVVSNSNLGATWTTVGGFESLTSGAADLPIAQDKEFFLVELDDNLAPRFAADPIRKSVAAESGVLYSGQSIAADAVDPDAGDTLTFSKIEGPAWLTVAGNGALGGTPDAGGADEGANYFTVEVVDNHGAAMRAKLQLDVETPDPGGSGTTVSFAPEADAFIKESDSASNFGSNKWLELNENTGGSKRYSYLRFNITGLPGGATITAVKLYITPNTDGATPYPQYADVDVYDVADNSWDESVVTWDNTALTLRAEVESPNTAIATLQNSTGSSDAEQSVDLTSAHLISGNGFLSLGLRSQDTSLGRFSSSDHSTEPAPRLEVTYE